jgi:hypothetical protein
MNADEPATCNRGEVPFHVAWFPCSDAPVISPDVFSQGILLGPLLIPASRVDEAGEQPRFGRSNA